MKKKYIFLLIIIAIPLYYKLAYPDYTYRYRMTVEIDTPEGTKSGSSVIEVHTEQWPEGLRNLFGGKTAHSTVKGEAVFVDLGSGKNVVALLTHGRYSEFHGARKLAPRTFITNKIDTYDSAEKAGMLVKMTGEKQELTGNLIPTIVTFDDTKEPESLSVVYAADVNWDNEPNTTIFDNMEAKFGSGYKFRAANIQLTGDPLEDKLDTYLPWVNNFQECKKAWRKIGHAPGKRQIGHPQWTFKINGEFPVK